MLKNLRKSESGFTLIELLIVVAIIGILAAIAIPQFASYRQRAYNSAAESDVKNARVAEESLFSDFQSYGGTDGDTTLVAAVTAAGGAGAVIDGAAVMTAAGNINSVATLTAGEAQAIGVSNNVLILATGDAALASVILVSEHRQGDRAFAMDSDSTILYYAADPAWVGVPIAGVTTMNPTVPAATAAVDNLGTTPAAGGAAPAANWTPK